MPLQDDADSAAALFAALAERYTLQREIGVGGSSTVYLADDRKHRRPVAIKVLHQELSSALGAARFAHEVEIAARLRHPHILPLFDSGEAADQLYYVMPFVDGESLRARLDREGHLPIDDAVRLAREIADALSYAHAHDVVHRDIKPDNILLESGHAVVADFGIARALSESGSARLTGTGMSIGTPQYMSPEQASGERDVDGRADLYALGCVLFEMLGGEPPFSGPTMESVVRQHIVAEPRPITELRPGVPPDVSAALTRAMAKNPADRFTPVSRFAEALGGTPVRYVALAQPEPEPTAPTPPWVRPAVIAAVTAAFLSVAAWGYLRGAPIGSTSGSASSSATGSATGSPDSRASGEK
ncbi:MAG: serine/threonine-protein kinase [Gemmatimonadota bacterium]